MIFYDVIMLKFIVMLTLIRNYTAQLQLKVIKETNFNQFNQILAYKMSYFKEVIW